MTNYYVKPAASGGNNANSGLSLALAWATIQKAGTAGSVTASGDIINVDDGIYSVSTMTTTKSGLTYKAINKWGPQIQGHQTAVSSICWTDTGTGNTFDGFDISNTGRLGLFADGDDAEVMNCYVHDIQAIGAIGGSGGSGICTNNGPRMQVHHNLVVRIETTRVQTGVQGIYPAEVSCSIYNNIVVDISQYGLHQWHAAGESDFYNNTVINCRDGCILIGGDGTSPGGISNHNTVYNNICGFSTYGIRECCAAADVANTTMRNNMIFGCSVPVSIIGSGSTESGRITTTTAGAKFVNYLANGTGDYHLSAGSPAIGACNTSFVPADDFDNVARPQNTTYDVGAYEYFTGGGDTTAPILTLPTGTQTGATTASITITTDEGNGRIWGCVSTNATETRTTIISLSEAAGTYYDIVATGLKSWNVTNLTASTTYYAHFAHDDAASNQATAVNSSAFTTAAAGVNSNVIGGRIRRFLHRG